MEGYYNLKGRNFKRGLRDPDDPRYLDNHHPQHGILIMLLSGTSFTLFMEEFGSNPL